jgi:L-2,4-diaminobutyric acid acetyltransferase
MSGRHSKPGNDQGTAPTLTISRPSEEDGGAMWRMARDSRTLDLNSSYSYLLMARDFAQTCAVARHGDRPVGFVTGYLRPDEPSTLVVWQVAVDDGYRGAGVANALVNHLVDQGPRHLETTITSDNAASIRLFTSVAEQRRAELTTSELFSTDMFPDGHAAELLYRIGPLS